MSNVLTVQRNNEIKFSLLGFNNPEEDIYVCPVFLVSINRRYFAVIGYKDDIVYFKLLTANEYKEYKLYCCDENTFEDIEEEKRLPMFICNSIEGRQYACFMTVENADTNGVLESVHKNQVLGDKLYKIYQEVFRAYNIFPKQGAHSELVRAEIKDFIEINDRLLNVKTKIKKVGVLKTDRNVYPVYMLNINSLYYIMYHDTYDDNIKIIPFMLQESLEGLSEIRGLVNVNKSVNKRVFVLHCADKKDGPLILEEPNLDAHEIIQVNSKEGFSYIRAIKLLEIEYRALEFLQLEI